MVVSENVAEDWIFVTRTISHTYTTSGNFTAFFGSCCRLSDLSNGADGDYREQTIVNIDLANWADNNSPPNSSLPVIVNIQQGNVTATFQVPGFDPDGDPLTYRQATLAEYGISNPTGLSVDLNTGLVTFSPPAGGFILGDTYALGVAVEDGQAQTIIDFLVEVVGTSHPPFFNYGPTPNNNSVFTVNPGTPIDFTIEADDADVGSTVQLLATGAPMGSTFSPGLPTTPAAGPVSTDFSWTPMNADVGSYVISITATDDLGVQAFTTVVINVSLAPVFDIPPTLGGGSLICLPTGAFSETYQASDNDPADNVSIISATVNATLPATSPTPPSTPGGGFPGMASLPSSLSFSPTIPTVAANPTSTVLSGNIVNADWGIYFLTMVAEDGFSETTELSNFFIINQDPYFTSPEPSSNVMAQVGVPFTMTITASDDDIGFGDRVAFADETKAYTTYPSWISISDDGNGTLTLSGTPTVGDAGINPVTVELHDRTTHFQHLHCSWQFQNFNIEVLECNIAYTATPTGETCQGSANGEISFTGLSGATNYEYSTDNGTNWVTTNPITGLAAGMYNVIVRDADDDTCESSTEVVTIAAGTSPDFDNDNVCDDIDLDDDNDGILDTDECDTAPEISFEFAGTFGDIPEGANSWENYRDLQNPVAGYTYMVSPFNEAAPINDSDSEYAITNGHGVGGVHPSSSLFPAAMRGHTDGSLEDAFLVTNASPTKGVFFREQVILDANTDYEFGAWANNSHLSASNGGNAGIEIIDNDGGNIVVGSASSGVLPTGITWVEAKSTFNTGTSTNFTIEVFNLSTGSGGNDFAIDDIFFRRLIQANCNDDGDAFDNQFDLDSDGDMCNDVLEAGYLDPDDDGILGTSPVTVDAFGRVLNEGGYTGNNGASTDDNIFIACCDIAITSVTPTDEVCPGADDGTITVAATCTTCTSINYSISGPVNVGPQASNVFAGLADGTYTVTVADSGDGSCTATDMNVVVAAGVDTEDPTFVDGSEILLYENDFESPLNPINASDCNGGIDLAPGINFWYGIPAYMFQQVFSVEAADVQWPGYSDPSGIGGRYAVGMLSSAQDDLLSLTFDADDKTFLNIRMDLSPIGLNGCATGNPTTPTMRLSVYDSPGGSFNINSPGTLLDFEDLTGLAPDPTDPKHVYIWQEVIAGLDISGSTDGNVSLVWDLRSGYYAAFDNLVIRASNVSAGSGCPEDFTIECIGDLPTAPTLMGFDNCTANPPVTFMESAINGAVNDQTVTRTWTVTDASNNSFSCVQDITVDDTMDPTPMCQDITVNLLAGSTYSLTAAEVNDTSTDNCGTTNLSIPATTFDCDDVGNTVSVPLTVDDDNGNDATCVSMVTITDTNNTCCDIDITSATPTDEVCPGDDDGTITVVATCTTCTSINYSISGPVNVGPQASNVFAGLADGTYTVTVADSGNAGCSVSSLATVAAGVDDQAPVTSGQSTPIGHPGGSTASAGATNGVNGQSFTIVDDGTIVSLDFEISSATSVGTTVELIATNTPNDLGCGGAVLYSYDFTAGELVDGINTHELTTPLSVGAGDGIVLVLTSSNSFGINFSFGNTYTGGRMLFNTCAAGDIAWDWAAHLNMGVLTCSPLTVALNASGEYDLTQTDLDQIVAGVMDNCSATADLTISANPATLSCSDLGNATVTVMVTDEATNTSSCAATVTVTDLIPPIITCPADFTGNTEPGICQANLDLTHATATDNCDVTISSDATFNGVRYIRLTQNLTGVPINLAEFEAYQSGINIALGAVVTSNIPSGINGNFTDGDLNNFMHSATAVMGNWVEVDLGSEQNIEYIRVHNRGDACCGSRSESFTLEYRDASNNVIRTDNDFDVYEGVNGPHFVNDYARTYLLGDNVVTWTATDAAGNTVTCPQTVTVVDNQDPTITCPPAVAQTADAGECEAAVTIGTPVTGDNCGVASVTNNFNNTSNASDDYPVGTTMVTWTVVDDNGRMNTCVQNVVITDDEDPEITCPADIVTSVDAGECFATVTYTEPVGTDNCPGAMTALISGLGSGGTPSVGTDNVTFEVTDAAGRTAQCTFNVTVQDTEAPTATCATNFTVNLDVNQMASVDAADINNGSSDNCGTANVSITSGQTAYDCDDVGQTYTVTLTVDDGNATSSNSTCSTMVTVGDANSNCCDIDISSVTPTDEVCPGDDDGTITVVATCGVCTTNGTTIQYSISGPINVGPQASNVFMNLPDGTYTVTVNESGNAGCTVTETDIIVGPGVDNMLPNAMCNDLTVVLDASGMATVTTAQLNDNSTDNCAIANVDIQESAIFNNLFTNPDFENGITGWTATGNDNNGGHRSTGGNPNGRFVINQAGQLGSDPSIEQTLTGLTIGQEYTFFADVLSSNVSVVPTFAVDLDGIELETFAAPNTSWRTISVTFLATAVMHTIRFRSEINGTDVFASLDNLLLSESGFTTVSNFTYTCDDIGPNTLTLLVEDVNGNFNSCDGTITVQDNSLPTFTCPTDQTIDLNGNCELVIPDLISGLTATDNCDVTFVQTPTATAVITGLVGGDTQTVTIEATDEGGNSTSCVHTITANDATAPTLTCPTPISVNNDVGVCEALVAVPQPSVMDNCLPATPAGTMADPFTSLKQARWVFDSGLYFFDVDGEQFSTYVECGGWIMIASSPSSATTDLTITNAVAPQSNTILPPAIYDDSSITHLRINATGGPNLPLDVETDNATVLANLANNLVLHTGVVGGTNEWTGSGSNRMVVTCNGLDLLTKVYINFRRGYYINFSF